MTPPTKLHPWLCLFALVVLCLTTSSCAAPAGTQSSSTVDEEVYIDLKQGFSLVIPSTWERERIPVSSPRHRQDTVEWRITSSQVQVGTLQVTTASRMPGPLQEQLASFHSEPPLFAKEGLEGIQHPAGPAFRGEGQSNLENIISLAIQGASRTYFITGRIAAADFVQVLPTLEKVILSFSILQN